MLNTELIWRRGNYLKYEKLSLPFDSVEKTLLLGLFNNFPTKENLQNIEIGNYQQVLLPLKKYLYSLIDQKLKTTKFKNLFIDISSVTQNLTNTIHLNLIDNILSQYGLPKELKYLAVIESNLSIRATSWVGAGGPWQFMPYTARDYGLVVNNVLDERRDYYKSTHAAARYLLTLYGQMKDWLLVIAAYNGGPGRVYSAIKKSGSRNFWSLQYYLPSESRNHVKKFIATHYIMEGTGGVTTTPNLSGKYDPRGGVNSFDAKPDLTEEEKEFASTQSITGKYNSLVIAKNLLMDIGTFNRYNPDFDNLMSINGNYDLRLPADKMQLFLANKYVILNECVQLLLGDNPEPPPNQSTTYPAPKKSKKKGK